MRGGNEKRRVVAAAMLLVSSAALVATSPAVPPSSNVEARAAANATLTFDSPVASTVVTFSATDEALWSDDPEIRITTAELVFTATGQWAGRAGVPAQPRQASDQPIVRLTTVALGRQEPLEPPGGRLTYSSVDPRETCPTDRDCRAQYELLVEWIDPDPDREVAVTVNASSRIQISGPESPPAGARTTLAADEPVAVRVPVISDGVGARVEVDERHPLAMWSVVLDADAAAIPAPLTWPIESRGSFAATVTPEPGQVPPDVDEPGVTIILIPDGDEEITPDSRGGAVRHAFDPFAGCLPSEPCQRRVTVVVRWFSAEPGFAAVVDWRLDAGIVYHGDVRGGPDAEIRATIDGETAVTDEGAVVSGTAEGLVTLDAADRGISERRTLELDIRPAALRSELLGGPVPAVTGTVTLEARSSAPVRGDPVSILASWEPADSYPGGTYDFPDPRLNGGPVDTSIFPAPACRADQACEPEMTLGLGLSANDTERLEGTQITVTWRVEVQLRYPPGSQPPAGAEAVLRNVP